MSLEPSLEVEVGEGAGELNDSARERVEFLAELAELYDDLSAAAPLPLRVD